MTDAGQWRRCSACKGPIAYGATHWVCSVSTCNRARTGLVFCSVDCWELHLPGARHREAWAVEATAPPAVSSSGTTDPSGGRRPGRRVLVRGPSAPRAPEAPSEVLIVASRLKEYVRARAGFNTSDGVLEPLSEIVRRAADEAIHNARHEGRRTVLERDIPEA